MLLFLISLGIIIVSVVVFSVDNLYEKRLKLLSILGVSMIIINLLNEIDINTSQLIQQSVKQPQFIPATTIQSQRRQQSQVVDYDNYFNKQVIRRQITFSSKLQPHQLFYYQYYVNSLNTNINHNNNNNNNNNNNHIINNTSSQQQLLIQHDTLQQDIISILKSRLQNNQDSILHINGISKHRMQLLLMRYLDEANTKSKGLNELKYQSVHGAIVYSDKEMSDIMRMRNNSNNNTDTNTNHNDNDNINTNLISNTNNNLINNHITYHIPPHIHQQPVYNYLLIPSTPSQTLLNFIYQQLIHNHQSSNQHHTTVIFMQLPSTIQLMPIYQFIQYVKIQEKQLEN